MVPGESPFILSCFSCCGSHGDLCLQLKDLSLQPMPGWSQSIALSKGHV